MNELNVKATSYTNRASEGPWTIAGVPNPDATATAQRNFREIVSDSTKPGEVTSPSTKYISMSKQSGKAESAKQKSRLFDGG